MPAAYLGFTLAGVCPCCLGPGPCLCGQWQSVGTICVDVSGFTNVPYLWLNGRYEINGPAVFDRLQWGGGIGDYGPANTPHVVAGGDGCARFAWTASLECQGDSLSLTVLMSPASTPGGGFGYPKKMLRGIRALTPGDCGAGVDLSIPLTLPPPPPGGNFAQFPPVQGSPVARVHSGCGGTGPTVTHYNAFCPDGVGTLSPTVYPPKLYVTFRREDDGCNAPDPPTGTGHNKTLAFDLVDTDPCSPLYRWCGLTAWANYSEDGPDGPRSLYGPVPTVMHVSAGGSVGAGGPVMWVGSTQINNQDGGYLSGGPEPGAGPTQCGGEANSWFPPDQGRQGTGDCYGWKWKWKGGFTKITSYPGGTIVPYHAAYAYSATLSATNPGGTLIPSDPAYCTESPPPPPPPRRPRHRRRRRPLPRPTRRRTTTSTSSVPGHLSRSQPRG